MWKETKYSAVAVLICIAILFLLLFGSRIHNGRPRFQRSLVDVITIKKAVLAYHVIYQCWPVPDASASGIDADGVFKATNAQIIKILRTPYKRDPFLELKESCLNGEGAFIDEWGRPYVVQIMASKNPTSGVHYWNDAQDAVLNGKSNDLQKYWVNVVKSQVNVYGIGKNGVDEKGWSVRAGDADRNGRIDSPPPPLFPAKAGDSADDLLRQGKIDDVREGDF